MYEGNDCTSRHTSLKPVGIPQNNFKPSVVKTSLPKTLFNEKQTPILLINRNFDYPVKIPKNIKPFPCRKNIHMWDRTSAYLHKKTKKCSGIDSGYNKRNIIPRPHPSYFSNLNFDQKALIFFIFFFLIINVNIILIKTLGIININALYVDIKISIDGFLRGSINPFHGSPSFLQLKAKHILKK